MIWLGNLRVFPLFELYLAVVFLLGLLLRLRQYREVLGLVIASPLRWPRVIQLIRQHAHILCTWQTLLPLILSGGLLLVQLLIRWYVFPGAILTTGEVATFRPVLPFVIVSLGAMLGFDAYCAMNVGKIDRPAIEKQLDQAEYWLRSWAAPVVRWLSLGYINPRSIVQKEVATALETISGLMNSTLYSVALQAGLRMLCGLTLWSGYLLIA